MISDEPTKPFFGGIFVNSVCYCTNLTNYKIEDCNMDWSCINYDTDIVGSSGCPNLLGIICTLIEIPF